MQGEQSRRETMMAALGVAVALGLPAPARSAERKARSAPGGLDTIAGSRGRRFGSAFAWGPPGADRGSFANPAYAALLERDCRILVPENEMKWQALRPSPTRFDFGRFDAMMVYAERGGFAVRGHNLLWHQPKWMPAWEKSHDFGARPVAEAERLLTAHIRTVCGRYGSRITAYDVVNEAVNPSDGTRYETALSRAMGGAQATLDLAFHVAREAAPHAELVYNDYMSWELGNESHRRGVLALLHGFKARGVPVDALGVQSHIGVGADGSVAELVRRQEPAWRAFLDEVTAMGYGLVITELDVSDAKLPPDPALRDAAVASYGRAYLDIMLSYPGLRDVLVWGMSDRYSWLQQFEPRADRVAKRPCPYGRDFEPKPLRAAIAGALAAAPTRSEASLPNAA